MKKWFVLLFVALLGGGGYYVWSGLEKGAEVAGDYEVESLTPEGVRQGLRSSDLKTRLDAVAQLEKLDPPARQAALLEALEAPVAPARLTAVTELAKGFASEADVVARLLSVAKEDPDDDVREAAFSALEKSGDPRVLTLACEVLTATETGLSLKLQAASTLDRLTGRQTAADLEGKLEEAEMAADEIGMSWDEWIGAHRDGLVWDPENGRFVPKE